MATVNVKHLDAGETAYLAGQLRYIKNRAYDEVLAPLKYSQLFPISSEAPAGATEITWRSYKGFGLAKIIADYASDFPRVDIGGTENTIKIKDIGAAYAYTLKEIRRSALSGENLPARKAVTVRRVIEEKINSLAWVGDSEAGIQGFINYPGTTEYTVPSTGTGVTKTWATKTADQILTDLNGIMNSVVVGTSGVEVPDTILLPLTQFNLIKNTRMSTYADTTIYQFFVMNNPGITITWVRDLTDAVSPGVHKYFAYKKDAEHLSFELPVAFEQLQEEKDGAEYFVPCMATVGGIIVYYPASIAWGSGI